VLWIDVTPTEVIVRRLLTAQRLSFEHVKRWGFEVTRERLVQTATLGPTSFVLVLSTGLRLEIPSLSATKAAILATRLPPRTS
jgi:hypothetical protein